MTPSRAWTMTAIGTIGIFTYVLYASYYMSHRPTLQYARSLVESEANETNYATRNISSPAGYLYVPGFTEPRSSICPKSGEDIKLLAFVMSAPSNHRERMAIRETWGHFTIRTDVAIAFLLGVSQDTGVEKSIADEADLYKDIVRARFFENYYNLTLKSMSMMQWVAEYCPKAKFLLKTDDDMYINMPKLLTFVDEHIEEDNAIFGKLAVSWKPIRASTSKYYISREEFGPEFFPNFTTGPSYLLPASLARSMYEMSLNASFLKLEDVFMTGIVAEALHVERISEAGFVNGRISLDFCKANRVISIHNVKYHEQFDLWKKLSDGQSKCP